jgi:hypothetical protein
VDLDFKNFDSDRLITEVKKRPVLYNWLIDWNLGSSLYSPDAPRPYITGPLSSIICYQLSGPLFLAKVPVGPQT